VLARRPEPDSARLAPLYAIDPNHLHAGDKQLMLETHVGPSSTTLLGTLAKNGELKTIGALLAERSQAASGEFSSAPKPSRKYLRRMLPLPCRR